MIQNPVISDNYVFYKTQWQCQKKKNENMIKKEEKKQQENKIKLKKIMKEKDNN